MRVVEPPASVDAHNIIHSTPPLAIIIPLDMPVTPTAFPVLVVGQGNLGKYCVIWFDLPLIQSGTFKV
jgi:hypothetical protein